MLLRATSTEAVPHHHQPDGSAMDPTRLEVTCEWMSLLQDGQQASTVHRAWTRRPSSQDQRARIHGAGCTKQGATSTSGGDRCVVGACSHLRRESPSRAANSAPDEDNDGQSTSTIHDSRTINSQRVAGALNSAPQGLGKRKPQGDHGPPRTRQKERRGRWAEYQRPTAETLQAVYFTVSWVAIGVIGSARGISEEQYAGEDEQQPAPASDPRNAGARARETRPYGRGSLGRGGGLVTNRELGRDEAHPG